MHFIGQLRYPARSLSDVDGSCPEIEVNAKEYVPCVSGISEGTVSNFRYTHCTAYL
jgi:hypothetical protein